MRGWGAPLVASAFWAGLLLWDLRPAAAAAWPWWAWVVVGCVSLAGAIATAPGRRGDDPISGSGLADADRTAVAAVTSAPADPSRSPVTALALIVVGVLLCGVGWAGLGALRTDHSLLRRLAPRTVTLLATLREDPEPSSFGWHALVDVSDVSWPGGAATIRETTWVSGNDELPSAARGDQLRIEGTLQIPDEAAFAATLAHRGLAVSVRAIDVERVGGSPSPFVRMTQVVRAFVGTTIERIFPPREAGLLLGLVLGDASKLDPVTTRDFQTTGLGHLLVVSGENIKPVCCWVLSFLFSGLQLSRRGSFWATRASVNLPSGRRRPWAHKSWSIRGRAVRLMALPGAQVDGCRIRVVQSPPHRHGRLPPQQGPQAPADQRPGHPYRRVCRSQCPRTRRRYSDG